MLVSTRFQVLFHSPPGVLFTFPSRYFSTIGHQVVFRLGGWSPRIPSGFLVSAGTLDTERSFRISLTGLSPSLAGLPIPFCYAFRCLFRCEPLMYYYIRFGLFRFRSPLLSESRLISLPPGTWMFRFPGFPSLAGWPPMTVTGFPHSDIHGSILACSSPWLFAAYRVLRRLLAPRHPPYALSSLTFSAAKAHTFMHVFSYWYFSLISFNVFALIRGCQSPSSGDWSFFFCEVFKVHFQGKTLKTKQ